MVISPFFNLIRWKNLVILATTLLIIKYGFIDIFTTESSLNHIHFIILLISNIFIAAAGYIINDILDVEIDKINKPSKVYIHQHILVKSAYNLYFFLNIIGVLAGFYIANYLNFPVLALIPIFISYVLYLYSISLKKIPIIGNMVIGSLVSLSILSLAFFDLILIENQAVLGYHYTLFLVLVDFALFAFLINTIREIIKDIEDIKGDKALNLNTLPIFIGIKKTKYVITFLVILLIIGIVYFVQIYLLYNSFVFYYFIVGILIPLCFFTLKLYKSSSKSDFSLLSLVLKIIMILGTLAIILISLTIKNVL